MLATHRTIRRAARTAVLTGVLAGSGLALAPLTSLTTVSPAAAEGSGNEARLAVDALVGSEADVASTAVPHSFPLRFGYRPATTDGLLGDPSGECSSPVPLPAEFTPACRQHDLGYDLLRHAGRSGATLPPTARRAVDRRLGVELEESCEVRDAAVERVTCLVWADVAEVFVRANSVRQGDGVPAGETPLSVAAAVGLALATVCAAGLEASRWHHRRDRGER
ncbi:MAG: hypothetical protein ACRCZD_06370 [Phycicoccus sp.]